MPRFASARAARMMPSFVVGKVLGASLMPSSLLLLAGLLGLLLRRQPIGTALLLGTGLACLGILVLPLGWWALRPLEDRFPPARLPDRIDGIIVLGGAVETEITAMRGQVGLNGAAERMTGFLALARQHPEALLAFSGGRAAITPGRLAEADVAHRFFDEQGLARDVIYEDRARTTDENAHALRAMLQPKAGQNWVLITSAMHMPRAMGLFHAVGWPVLPWPVAYKTSTLHAEYAALFSRRVTELDWAAHEWLGLVAARLFGRTAHLFPAPDPA